MNTKQYLKQYETMHKTAERFKREYEQEVKMIDAIRSAADNDGMPHSSAISDPTLEKAIRLSDKATKWKIAELDALEKRQEVFEAIMSVTGIEGEVLQLRYIELMKWEEICVEIGYSWQHTHRLHKQALKIVDDMR